MKRVKYLTEKSTDFDVNYVICGHVEPGPQIYYKCGSSDHGLGAVGNWAASTGQHGGIREEQGPVPQLQMAIPAIL
jgi:hypothetical protein